MERKKLFFKIGLMFILLALICSQSVQAVDIVGFTLNAGDISTGVSSATSGLATNTGATMTTNGVTTLSFSSGTGQTCYNFTTVGTSGWKTTIFSTALYNKLTVGFQMKATGTGPRDFQGQYSTDGTNYFNIPDDPNDATDTPAFSLTTGFANYKFILPAACNNKTNLYLRWVVRTSSKVTGTGNYGFTSTANATLYGITVQGELFVAPTSQAKDISIRSVTPTTITVGCSHGTGNRRVLYMNTTNSFTNPIDDTPFGTPNTTYASGQQLVYDGTGDQVTVTVPDSKNTYWFKYYEYNMLDQLIKIDVNFLNPDGTTPISGNPKECKLENIHSPSAVFGLTRAALSAIIDTPTKSAITERGFYYSTDPNVNDTDNGVLINEKSTQGGAFSLDIPGGVDRATTIYFKAYVINSSGKILSEEASFNNTPIFTGSGNWETPARWTVGEVPGANGDATYGDITDSPIIRGNCTLTADNQVTDLLIESGKLTISKATSLNVNGTLTNSVGVLGILIKATASSSDPSANGSLTFANGSPKAIVEMLSIASWDLNQAVNNKYHWQFFGIPVKSLKAGNTFNFGRSFVREWDESVTSIWDVWSKKNDGTTLYEDANSTLTQSKGYELVQQAETSYAFAGDLLDTDFTQPLSYTSTAAYKGQNIFGNPFTAAIDIIKIQFTNAENAVYMYNTGTFNQWSATGGAPSYANAPGTYTGSTPGTAGKSGVPAQIPTMQSFLVVSNAGGGSITIPRPSALTKNTDKQRVKSSNPTVSTRIDVIGTHSGDRMWIFTDPNCTRNFDNGWDCHKMLGSTQVAQIYGLEDDGVYQIDAVNNLNNSYIGFQPGTDTQFKLVFNHENASSLYGTITLIDLVANISTDITQSGSEYAFTASPTDPAKRFKIVISTTSINPTLESTKLDIYNSNNVLFINNKANSIGDLKVYDTLGHLIIERIFEANTTTQIPTTLGKGVYIVKATVNSEKSTKCIILN